MGNKAVPHLLASLLGVETLPPPDPWERLWAPRSHLSPSVPRREVPPMSPFLDEITITVV